MGDVPSYSSYVVLQHWSVRMNDEAIASTHLIKRVHCLNINLIALSTTNDSNDRLRRLVLNGNASNHTFSYCNLNQNARHGAEWSC